MQLNYKPYLLYFKRPFHIAHGIRSSTPVVITRLEHNGVIGYGEASMPPYLGETHESVAFFLDKVSVLLRKFNDPFCVDDILLEIDRLASGNTAAKASVDIALHDLNGKIQGKACSEILGTRNPGPFTSYTLGIDEPDILREKVAEGKEFKVFKVKLNGENDRKTIETIRSVTDKAIAVDVNQGWQEKEKALEMIHWLKEHNVLFIEQPLQKDKWDDANWLYERSPLPLFADESFQRYPDLDRMKDCYHGINIKLMKCTGMNEAFRMIRQARKLNLKILIGCMSETSCAISAAAQLSGLCDHADLDGNLLIKNDLFKGIGLKEGRIVLNGKPGIGVEPLIAII
jgi:L-alanine-DL-glutamate epimerase-like enolase superfamily enzyme